MQMKIQNLARMRAINGDYTVFTTTSGEQGIANRQGDIIYGPTDKHQHITHIWGTLFERLSSITALHGVGHAQHHEGTLSTI